MMCAAERSQLATISGRTSARCALVGRLSQIAGMCRSHARARCERRLCSCARVNMISLREPGTARYRVSGYAVLSAAAAGEVKAEGPGIPSRRSSLRQQVAEGAGDQHDVVDGTRGHL